MPVTSGSSVIQQPSGAVLDLIGRTPLLRLRRFEQEVPPGVELYAKAEWQNPGGSVKDRAAARMVIDGETTGRLVPGKTILDATSGNTGIAYAMVGAAKGYPVKLCVPDNASPERKIILRALGAELVAHRSARRHRRRDSGSAPPLRCRPGPLFLSGSVQQRLELARALRHDGARDHRADERPPHALRRRTRHERHVYGDRPPIALLQPEHPAHFVSARFGVPRARRPEAHGDGDCARHLRSVAR